MTPAFKRKAVEKLRVLRLATLQRSKDAVVQTRRLVVNALAQRYTRRNISARWLR